MNPLSENLSDARNDVLRDSRNPGRNGIGPGMIRTMRTVRWAIGAAVWWTATAGATIAAPSLDVGDPAPPLHIAEWVKGKPVDLSRDAARKIHVIEFWATWCPPCKMSIPLLTQLQNKFKKDVVIVGVTEPDARGNSPSAIRRFVREQGENMGYTVAIDDGRTSRDYLEAAGALGIPHAFVIDKNRKIVWQGSPLDPALEKVLSGLVAGTYDLNAALLEKKVARKLEELNVRAQLGQWQAVWDGLIDVLRMDPANEVAMDALQSISVDDPKMRKTFEKWVRTHIRQHRGNPTVMRRVAEMLCNIAELEHRLPELAIEAARAAYEASPEPDARTLVVYARALYQVGRLDRAIALQEDAVARAGGDEERAEFEAVLDYYKTCRRLQKQLEN